MQITSQPLYRTGRGGQLRRSPGAGRRRRTSSPSRLTTRSPQGAVPLLCAEPSRPARGLSLSGDAIFLPEAAVSGDEKVQIEPEVALWCELEYAGSRWWPSIPRRLAPTTTAPSVAPMPTRSARRRTGVKRARAGREPAAPDPLLPQDASSMTTASPAIWSGTGSCTLRDRQRGGGLQLLPRSVAGVGHRQVQPSAGRRPGRAYPGAAGPGGAPGPCAHQHWRHPLHPFGETRFLAPGDTACVVVYPASRYSESATFAKPSRPAALAPMSLSCSRRSRPVDRDAFPTWGGIFFLYYACAHPCWRHRAHDQPKRSGRSGGLPWW